MTFDRTLFWSHVIHTCWQTDRQTDSQSAYLWHSQETFFANTTAENCSDSIHSGIDCFWTQRHFQTADMLQHAHCQKMTCCSTGTARRWHVAAQALPEDDKLQHRHCQKMTCCSTGTVRRWHVAAQALREDDMLQHRHCQRICWSTATSRRWHVAAQALLEDMLQHRHCQKIWCSTGTARRWHVAA